MSELGDYIQLYDNEDAGAKEGYVKDKQIAENAAHEEEEYRNNDHTPEEANRSAEEVISRRVGFKTAKKLLDEKISTYAWNYGFDDSNVHDSLGEAAEIEREASQEYDKFQSDLDSKDLDKLRAKIRNTGEK